MDSPQMCPKCGIEVDQQNYFCPNCAAKLREKPLSTDLSAQLKIYVLSLLLPPFGILPAFKYLKQSDSKSKKIGLLSILLTIISIMFAAWLTTSFTKNLNNSLQKQLQLYENLGY